MKQPAAGIVTRSSLVEFWIRVQEFLHARRAFAKKEGLSAREYELLLIVKANAKHRLVNVSFIADRLFVQHHVAAGIVKRLAAKGLISIQRNKVDRRCLSFRLTAAGRSRLDRIVSRSVQGLADEGPRMMATLSKILREDIGSAATEQSY